MSNQDNYIRQTIRIPPELCDLLKTLASKSERSLNAEIIHRLSESINPEKKHLTTGSLPIEEAANKIMELASGLLYSSQSKQLISKDIEASFLSLINSSDEELLIAFNKLDSSEKNALLISALPNLISLLTKLHTKNQ